MTRSRTFFFCLFFFGAPFFRHTRRSPSSSSSSSSTLSLTSSTGGRLARRPCLVQVDQVSSDCCRLCTTMKPPLFFRTRTHACHLLKTEPAVCAVRLLTVTTAHYGRHHFSAQRLLNECFGMGPSDVSSQVEVTAMTSPCEFTSMSWELILPASAGIMTVDQVCHYIEDARNIGFHGWSSAGAALVKVRSDLGYRVH